MVDGAVLAPRVGVEVWLEVAAKPTGAPRAITAAAARMEAQNFMFSLSLSRSPCAIAAASGLGSGKAPPWRSAKRW
jgi:hypothetical protein